MGTPTAGAVIRAKVVVQSETRNHWNMAQRTIVATPVYPRQGEVDENLRFHQATPSGKIELTMDTAAADRLQLGKEYYVDFIPAVDPALVAEDAG